MKYLSYITNNYSLKNSLEKAVYEFLQSRERELIEPTDLVEFKSSILAGIEKLNTVNKRCKPVDASWSHSDKDFSGHDDHALWIGSGTICNFRIYASRT